MEFGHVQDAINDIDFSLPPDTPGTKRVLEQAKGDSELKIYVGASKWGQKSWIGKIYPPKTPDNAFLPFYCKNFKTVEFGNTFYNIPDADQITKWVNDVSDKPDFKFCPKMYQGVTHRGSLKGKDFITTEFLRGIVAFEKHLGPVFVQVSDSFSPNRRKELYDYLASLPKDLTFFLEVRHPDWFAKADIQKEMFETLASLNMGAVITDTAGRRDCAHMHLTIPKAFIRYVGNSLHKTDYTRIDAWVKRMKYWLDHGLKELYFFMHMHDEATSPELTVYLVDKMNAACGLNLIKPKFFGDT